MVLWHRQCSFSPFHRWGNWVIDNEQFESWRPRPKLHNPQPTCLPVLTFPPCTRLSGKSENQSLQCGPLRGEAWDAVIGIPDEWGQGQQAARGQGSRKGADHVRWGDESGGPSVSETGLVRGRQLSLLWTYVPYSSQCIWTFKIYHLIWLMRI